jgi:VCBS repeat-containing protein
VPDAVRYLPERRAEFMAQCERALVSHGRAFVRVSGDWTTRLETAVRAVDALLARSHDEVTRARGTG